MTNSKSEISHTGTNSFVPQVICKKTFCTDYQDNKRSSAKAGAKTGIKAFRALGMTNTIIPTLTNQLLLELQHKRVTGYMFMIQNILSIILNEQPQPP